MSSRPNPDRGKCAAAMTAPAPPFYMPPRTEQSSGYFDLNRIGGDTDSSRPSLHGPALILPIVSSPPRSVRSVAPRPTDAVPIHSGWGRIVGFVLVWMVTTGAGAVLVGHRLAADQMARAGRTLLAALPGHGGIQSPGPSASLVCPKSAWEPPLVSVQDLPIAAPRGFRVRVGTAPPPPAATRASLELPASAANATPFPGPSQHRAKAAPAGSSRSLEDWMRREVDVRSKKRP